MSDLETIMQAEVVAVLTEQGHMVDMVYQKILREDGVLEIRISQHTPIYVTTPTPDYKRKKHD